MTCGTCRMRMYLCVPVLIPTSVTANLIPCGTSESRGIAILLISSLTITSGTGSAYFFLLVTLYPYRSISAALLLYWCVTALRVYWQYRINGYKLTTKVT